MPASDSKKAPLGMRIGESAFCILYLLFAYAAALIFFLRGGKADLGFALMTFLLAAGDSFHLIPRILINLRGDLRKKDYLLGLGNLISSVTMTIFYLIFYLPVTETYSIERSTWIPVLWGLLAALRIVLCLFPQNNWFKPEGNFRWAFIRNIPFLILGLCVVAWLFMNSLSKIAVLVILSFAFYIPVALFAKKKPMLGMLMIPKTICYVVMICIFLLGK